MTAGAEPARAAAAREARVAKVARRLAEEGVAAALFEDGEGCRDKAVRYLSGQPGDALLVVAADGRSILVAWDLNLARLVATAGEILAYADFSRQSLRALAELASRLALAPGSTIELPSTFAYPRYVEFVEGLPEYDLLCRARGVDDFVRGLRSIKEDEELALYRRAASLTNATMDLVVEGLRSGSLKTELDLALFIERRARESGCEGTGFETLAAGPKRSWGIHAFPSYGEGPFATQGLSILDFGLCLEGYATDVTMSFAAGRLGSERERMIGLVERAHEEAINLLAPGVSCREIALRVDDIFAKDGFVMPHSLGHGIGLDAHEAPFLRSREDCADVLAPGQIVTIEPGLYDPELGGVRLEDDILITETGHEKLTSSRIVRI